MFAANAAWTVAATMAFNLALAVARIAGARPATATTAAIRRRLIHIAARLVTTARRLHPHLPATRPWATALTNRLDATCGPAPEPST